MSLVGEPETATERVIPFEDRTNHINKPSHSRTCSMQHHKETLISNDSSLSEKISIKDYLVEIIKLKNKNKELQKIYDQTGLSLKFKKSQFHRVQAEYNDGI